MQKTYDECYLTCSTAIYFEGQVGRASDQGRHPPPLTLHFADTPSVATE